MDLDEASQDQLAPCGLSCARCLAYKGGTIRGHAAALLDALQGFEKHADRFSAFDPVFSRYPAFREMAEWFARGNCNGCRSGQCLHGGCRIGRCVEAKGVTYCFECDDFPCQESGLNEPLLSRWIAMNRRMAEIGPDAFLAESNAKPRY